MHDIKFIRDNPEAFDAGLKRRGLAGESHNLLALDDQRRQNLLTLENAQARRKALSAEYGKLKSSGETPPAALVEELEKLKAVWSQPDLENPKFDAELNNRLAHIPNLPADDVPAGKNEDDNVAQKYWGEPRRDAIFAEHFDLGTRLGLDFESAQSVAGARFVYLRGSIARLSRALGAFMLNTHTEKFGYEEVNPPLLVRDEAVFGTAQLPKFADDLFKTTDGRWLIPTAEVSLTNLVREQILANNALPLRFTALTPCFRSEAGAAGKDTRGLIRQHQFEKVELVSICRPEESAALHEEMTRHAEHILEALALPYRRMVLCTGDMGFSARKTYDLEVWLPGQDRYREISSISNCGDFQARRMNARYRPLAEKGSKPKTAFVHTLNGSGVAVGRALVAVLENYQQADGSVTIPAVLQPYMGGMNSLMLA